MSTPHTIMWVVACCIGLPAAYRNPTAAALALSWLAGEATWMGTGQSLPLNVYIMADTAVIAIMFAKAIVRAGPKMYPSAAAQARAFVTDLTHCDKVVLALFLLGAWPVYISGIHPYYQWWALYYITIAQFVFAGLEPLVGWWRRRMARIAAGSRNNVLNFAPAYRRRVQRYFGAEPLPSTRPATQHYMRGGGGG